MNLERIPYAVLTLLFSQIGIQSFLAGNVKKGVCTILSAVVTFGVVGVINAVYGIISAINIFTMSDEDYAAADKANMTKSIVFFYKD